MLRISRESKSPSFLCDMNSFTSAYFWEMKSSFSTENILLKPLIKCIYLVTSSSLTAMLPEVSYAICRSCPCFTSRLIVPPIEITSSSGCGENTIILFGKGKALSGRSVSSAFGLPPGQPVIVCCRSLNTRILTS